MRQIDYLSEALFEDVGEIEALNDLVGASLMRYIDQIESALPTVHERHFVVTPLVIVILVQCVDCLVFNVEERHFSQPTSNEEWAFLRVVGRQRHQVSAVFVEVVGVLNLNWLLQTLGVIAIEQEVAGLVPSSADDLVVIILANVPDVLILQVVLIAPSESFHANGSYMDSRNCSDCQFSVVVNSAYRPNSTNIPEMGCIQY